MKPATCPLCHSHFTWWQTMQANNIHVFECPRCGGALKPTRLKSWLFAYWVCFLLTVVPAKLIQSYTHTFLPGLLVGLLLGLTGLAGIWVYTYRHTIFEPV